MELDIRSEAGRLAALDAVERADVIVEGNRPRGHGAIGLRGEWHLDKAVAL